MSTEDRNAKIISWIIIGVLILTMWYMLDLVLLTFIIGFIFYNLMKVICKRMQRVSNVKIPENLVLLILYILVISVCTIIFSEMIPAIAGWVKQLGDVFSNININDIYAGLDPRIVTIIEFIDVDSMVRSLGLQISGAIATASTGLVGLVINLLISVLLSFIVLVERNKIRQFGENIEKSRFSDVYRYLVKFGGNFSKTFGTVMIVQITIAFVNTVLSVIMLTIMGFPAIPALGAMIFVLGLIPVAGVIISMIPLCLIALSIGGIIKVIEIIVMVCILHAIEAYILNPKLMSNKTRLPVCFVFMILLVGEHYLGVWGLLIGVPVFIFLMNMLEVDYQVDTGHKFGKRAKKEKTENENQ